MVEGSETAEPASGPVAWVLSAKSQAGLRGRAARLAARARSDTAAEIEEIASSLVSIRAAFDQRAVVIDETRAGLLAGVDALSGDCATPNLVSGTARAGAGMVFVFPGQGTQWSGMATGLLRSAPVFAEQVRECDRAFSPFIDWSVESVLAGADDAPTIDRVDVVQPVLFTMMVSLAALWRSCGVEPAAVVGHSQGEIAAAQVAGALSLSDAAGLVASRSRALLAIRGRGAMVTVLAPNEQVRDLLSDWEGRLWIAAVNGPTTMTVSGDADALAEFEVALSKARLLRWRVPGVDFAAHSGHVDEIRDELLRAAKAVQPVTADIAFYSTVSGSTVDTATLDEEYWYRNLRQPVRFDRAAQELIADGHHVFLECSAQPVLTTGLQDIAEQSGVDAAFVPTLRLDDGGPQRFLRSLAEAYVLGVAVDWQRLYPALGATPGDDAHPTV